MRVRIDGLRDFQRALRHADRDLPKQLRKAWNEIAEDVAEEARRRVPVDTGRLRDSIRPHSQQRYGQVAMGRSSVPYAGWIEFGGRRPHERDFVRQGRYLFPVADELAGEIQRRSVKMVDKLAQRAGL